MGASSSVLSTEDQFVVFTEVREYYDLVIAPQIASGSVSEEEGYRLMAEKFNNVSVNLTKGNNSPAPKIGAVGKHASFVNSAASAFEVGDIVKVNDNGLFFEGVVVSCSGHVCQVDLGDAVESFNVSNCFLILKSSDFEVGDKVQFKPSNSEIYFQGTVVFVNNLNHTYDIKLLSDDEEEEDIERGVPYGNMRKLMTGRDLSIQQFKKSVRAVQAMNAFLHFHK